MIRHNGHLVAALVFALVVTEQLDRHHAQDDAGAARQPAVQEVAPLQTEQH